MPLPPPDIAREPLHTRSIRVNSYARADGQWDLEAELIDIKSYDFDKRNGTVTHPAGEPIHHMHLRVTIDAQFAITAAVAAYDAAPYDEHCSCIAPDYQALVGMNLLRNFRQAVKNRFARVAGCTHLTELSYVLPTVAVQTMSNQRRQEQAADPSIKPFQLSGCHALRLSGPVAQEYYPQWYVAPEAEAKCE
ncbi:DUF2889 domain-containing protein [Pusillimonas sp. MFBS29]|uniref:DUF2889 domain-containing protein n=1 Tax=Pusillimonas sp. MFBS29 TaxID=2886690 RepID=UPI001D11B10E|nr:DUF2889 domain-containing protein [Pusillimonas sp. MFBS29]MCC2595379.1 DUF2889 domain-containing protein [Pusillimonas sp. MFBS29]